MTEHPSIEEAVATLRAAERELAMAQNAYWAGTGPLDAVHKVERRLDDLRIEVAEAERREGEDERRAGEAEANGAYMQDALERLCALRRKFGPKFDGEIRSKLAAVGCDL
ncbi:MAG TPA: hypothetical protein VFG62_06925 [Rhodopila sp.]|jgi:hypothetical protein|nr:hypothetical protein [Rhodopila sp.]